MKFKMLRNIDLRVMKMTYSFSDEIGAKINAAPNMK